MKWSEVKWRQWPGRREQQRRGWWLGLWWHLTSSLLVMFCFDIWPELDFDFPNIDFHFLFLVSTNRLSSMSLTLYEYRPWLTNTESQNLPPSLKLRWYSSTVIFFYCDILLITFFYSSISCFILAKMSKSFYRVIFFQLGESIETPNGYYVIFE